MNAKLAKKARQNARRAVRTEFDGRVPARIVGRKWWAHPWLMAIWVKPCALAVELLARCGVSSVIPRWNGFLHWVAKRGMRVEIVR